MPLIRLARDKRGLDTLYLLHQRRDARGEPRLRVLYFCAMPQGLQFGRPPLDESAQQLLERRYPDVEFDWPALQKDIEQRRLPAPALDPQVRRARPAKTERRPAASEVAAEKPAEKSGAGKRRRRRGGQAAAGPGGGVTSSGGAPASDGITQPAAPQAAPIIE